MNNNFRLKDSVIFILGIFGGVFTIKYISYKLQYGSKQIASNSNININANNNKSNKDSNNLNEKSKDSNIDFKFLNNIDFKNDKNK